MGREKCIKCGEEHILNGYDEKSGAFPWNCRKCNHHMFSLVREGELIIIVEQPDWFKILVRDACGYDSLRSKIKFGKKSDEDIMADLRKRLKDEEKPTISPGYFL